MTQFWCLNKFSKQIKSTQSQFISGNHCEPGTSGCESGKSGIIRILRVCFRILRAWFCHRGPTNVLNLSLSHSLTSLYHSLSRQLSLPHALTLSPQTLGLKPSLNLISRPREPPIGEEDLLLRVLLPGVLWIPSSLREKGLIQGI